MDIAKLGVSVTNQGIEPTTKSLRDLKAAAVEVTGATENVTKGAARAAAGIKTEAEAAKTTAGAMRDVALGSERAASTQSVMAKQAVGGARALTAVEVAAQEAGMTLGGYELSLKRAAKEQADFNASARQAAMNPIRAPTVSGRVGVPTITASSIGAIERSAVGATRAVSTLNVQAGNAARSLVMMSGGGMAAATGVDALATSGLLLNPVVLAIAAALAVAYGALQLFKSDTDKAADNDAFIQSLGLSKKELKELKNTSVTTGDVLKGFWRTIDQDGKVSKTFGMIKEAGIGTFRVILESAEWFIAGTIAGFEAVAHAAKGIAMVLTGDFSGFDYFNHSFDGLIENTKAAKASMDQFWASVQKNTIAANHERVTAQADAIKADRSVKAAATETDDRFKARSGEGFEFSRGAITKAGEVLGKDPFRQVNAGGAQIITDMEKIPTAINKVSDAFRGFGQVAADAATRSDYFWSGMVYGIEDLARAFEAKQITKLFSFIGDWAGSKAQNGGGAGWSLAADFFNPTPNAMGGVYSSPSLHSYANGVYDRPQAFAFAKGGVFAEAGPEAIMPLSRGSNGKLGVAMHGGGGLDINSAILELAKGLGKEFDRRSAANRTYSDTKISGFNRALPKRLGQIDRQGT